jgi:hypothetical protein
MAMDYTVIQAVRQRFGDQSPDLDAPVELEAPFVGPAKDFPFSCPNVETGQMAVLQFESVGVAAGPFGSGSPPFNPRNILRINGVDIPGGVTPGQRMFWKAHSLLVPANVLTAQNILHIESVQHQHGPGTSLDNFIIDNVVIFFKTRV